MFICPNCDEKIHWKHSLNIKPHTVITCTSCGARLKSTKKSYYYSMALALILLFTFAFWVTEAEKIIWLFIALPLSIVGVAFLFYRLITFERIEDEI